MGRMMHGFGLVLGLAMLGACGGDNIFADGPFVETPSALELSGLWTGSAEITQRGALVSNLSQGDQFEDGFTFPVALLLRPDRTFELRSVDFPTGQESKVCAGVFRADQQTLQFFSDRLCRALPLNSFTIGRSFPDALILTAQVGDPPLGTGQPRVGDIRVRIVVERDVVEHRPVEECREEKCRDERCRDERSRDEKCREERCRDERSRDEKCREERCRDERLRDEKCREERH